MDDIGTVGQRIRELREKAGLTQQQVAEKIGLHWTSISQWERGRNIPREASAARLAKALGVEVQDILQDVSGAHVSQKNSEKVAAFLDFLREAMRCCRQASAAGGQGRLCAGEPGGPLGGREQGGCEEPGTTAGGVASYGGAAERPGVFSQDGYSGQKIKSERCQT